MPRNRTSLSRTGPERAPSRIPRAGEFVVNIGERLRRLRKESDLSIQKLALRAGVSPAAIYKIERNEMVPTVTILMRIALALNTRVSFFIGEDEAEREVVFVPREGRLRIHPEEADGRLIIERVSSGISRPQMEAVVLNLAKGVTSGADPLTHPGEELIICLAGEVEFEIQGKKQRLREGDSLHFKATLPHSWRNTGTGEARMLSVITPPPFQ